MEDANHKIDYLKNEFRTAPRDFNHHELNLEQKYKDQLAKDLKEMELKQIIEKKFGDMKCGISECSGS